jgi:uncharacterized protein
VTRTPRQTHVIKVVLAGAAAGLMSGVFGVGGGLLLVPALIYVLAYDQRLAHGTSLAAILPIAFASLMTYIGTGNVDWAFALWISIGAIAGAVLGTKLLKVLPIKVIAISFIIMLVVTAVRLLMSFEALGREDLTAALAIQLVVLGLLSGTLAGLLGVGGGVIMVPAMILLFQMPPVIAKGTSVAVIIPTALMGTWRNRRNDNTDIKAGLTLGVAGMLAAVVGGILASKMDPNLSNLLFAILLFFVIIRQVSGLRKIDH